MGFMSAWQAWSQRQYDRWGSKLQPAYSNIKNWKTPEWAKLLFADIWDNIDEELQKKLYKLVYETCKQFDDEFAAILVQQILGGVISFLTKK